MSITLDGTSGITASGNITGNYILGNGSQLSGVDATGIQSGTSNVKIVSSGGNATVSVAGTSNVAVFASTGANITGTLGVSGNVTGGNLSGTSIVGTVTTAAQTNITSVGTLTSLAVTGNITSGNVQGTAHTGTTGTFTGNITGGNLSVSTGLVTLGGIVNANGNAIGNIGSSTLYFNTVFAKATSAQYADLAELYTADNINYPPGTCVAFGGTNEITQTTTYAQTDVAGVVSTNPAYIMNAGTDGLPVALQGRVPCRVVGTIAKGDLITSSNTAGVATRLAPEDWRPGAVIGKSLQDFDSETEGVIEVVVGRV